MLSTEITFFTERIRKEFPDFHFSNAVFGGQGEDHTVLLVDDEWIFRFRKDVPDTGPMAQEIRLLKALQGKTEIAVPNYEFVSKNKDIGGYRLIRGEDLTADSFASLSALTQDKLAKQLGAFLSVLHGLPTSVFSADAYAPLDVRSPEFYARRFKEERRPVIAKALSKELLSQVDDFYKDFLSVPAGTPRVTHGDLQSDHILLAPSKDAIAGVIDFTDSAFWDGARDFAFFWGYGEAAVVKIYENYAFKNDSNLLRRSKWHAARLFIDRLYYDLHYEDYADLNSDKETLLRVITSLK